MHHIASEKPSGSLSHARAQWHQPPGFQKPSRALDLKLGSIEVKIPAVCCSSDRACGHLLLPPQPGLDPRGLISSPTHTKAQHQDENSPTPNPLQRRAGWWQLCAACARRVGCLHSLTRALLGQQKLSSWDTEFAKALGTSMLSSAPLCRGRGVSFMRLCSLHLPRFGAFPLLGWQPKAKGNTVRGSRELGRQTQG